MTTRTSARLTGTVLITLLLLAPGFVTAAMPRCAQCGMMVDEHAPFSAKMTEGGATTHFCDIGDLLAYLKAKKGSPSAAVVKDYPSGATLEATKAIFVKSPKNFHTPMGWGIAAFQDRKVAETFGTALDLDAIIKQLN
ncbi:MAG: nitrous oxide reductase accessory protein NosL [Nitrospiraceae bacterium]|nr:nitrous oxide reductase accessory protein NosL [Nitrospiraceae bacterium]